MRIKESSKKTLYLVLGLLLLSICSLTIVYAALSAVLRISGNSEVVASNWDIHLANPEVKSGSVHNNLPIINGNSLSFNTTLSLPRDYYEFTVDVVNDGSIDAMIDSVSITPELTTEQAKYIRYEVSYQNGESINTKQTLSKGTSTPIKVRVEYRKDISSSDLPSNETNLSIKVTLNYVQSDGSGSEIVKDGHIYAKVISGDYDTVGSEVCIDTECFYVISSTNMTVTMLSKYNLHVGNRVDDNWKKTSIVNPTGIQNSNAIGWFQGYSTNNPAIGTISFSNTNYWYNNGLNSNYGINFPAYVYDSNSNLYSHVENYKSYLNNFGVIINEARLITYEELIQLGCNASSLNCSGASRWVYATSYWSGSVGANCELWHVASNSYFGDRDKWYIAHGAGIRPVITISKDYF